MRCNCSYPGVQRRELWMGPDLATVVLHKSALTLVVIVVALCIVALIILAPVLSNEQINTRVCS